MSHAPEPPTGRLALENGSVYVGHAFGATGQELVVTAEAVFNTALTGYQESITDPSYQGQILIQTSPLVGNTGVNRKDTESDRVQVSGFVVRELANRHSNYRAERSLDDELALSGVLGLTGIDTRALTRELRSRGSLRAALTDRADLTDAQLVQRAREAPTMVGQNLAEHAAGSHEQSLPGLGHWPDPHTHADGTGLRVLALDCGMKANIHRHLTDRGCQLDALDPATTPDQLLHILKQHQHQGLFLSNGPGDPAAVQSTVAALRAVLHDDDLKNLPIFGICLGHQLLALALGATTYKLKFGHRGANQPVCHTPSGRVEITSQNHGFAVEADSLAAAGATISHTHLNDHTVAGFELPDRPVFAVQFHPEASPGPHDSSHLFDRFVRAMLDHAAEHAPSQP